MKQIRWGILSSAKIAENAMVPAIKEANNAMLQAVASSSGKAAATAEKWGALSAHDSYEALLNDPAVDAVYIPLPNKMHKEWVIKSMRAGKHVLVEKPAAINSEEIEEIIKVEQETGMIWMEGFMYQFHPQHAYVKDRMAAGEIGTIKRIRASFSFTLDLSSQNIRLDSSLGGGSLYDIGCYCVHASRFLLDQEPRRVYSEGRRLEAGGVDISSSAILSFDNVDSIIDCSFDEPPLNRYEVIGTKGRIEVPFAFRPDQNPDKGQGEVIIKDQNGAVKSHEYFDGNQFTKQIEHFSQCVLEDLPLWFTPENTLNNMSVIETMYKSQKKNL